MVTFMELVDKMEEFSRSRYEADLYKAAREEAALVIDFSLLDRFDPITADMLLEAPDLVLAALRDAAERIAGTRVAVRVRNLPPSREIRIRSLRSQHLGKMWCVDATIRSASEVKPQIRVAVFKCPECDALISVEQDSNIIKKPLQCECGRRGDFPLTGKKLMDVRWLTGTEPFETVEGEKPGDIAVFLKEDLTSPRMQRKTDPGARLKIVGILRELPKHIRGKLSTKMDMYLEALHAEPAEVEFEELEITHEDEKLIRDLAANPRIYDLLRASIAPGIFGHEEIKEAILLQLFGGVVHRLPDGSRIRGNLHILLTGDPGTGKTALMKLVTSIAPRARYVSGTGASGAGMTATVTKNEVIGSWVLEAGALILANKSVIAIDEFDKINRDDQVALHEAMSIETVSIAKASIVATLPAQTAVLAGANPKLGRFDAFRPIAEQLNIPETLLSRFDVKFALRDVPDKGMDERLADHIIMSRTNPETVMPAIDVALLRKYIAYAKKNVQSLELPEEAAKMLKNFYIDMRTRSATEETSVVAITLRQYEALHRLAEASAKIRLDTKILEEDAERAIRLMQYSMTQLGYDFETGRFDVDRLEGGVAASKRQRINKVLDIIELLQKESKEIAVEDVRAEAENQGIEGADEIIEHLKREGAIFEPRPGFLRKI